MSDEINISDSISSFWNSTKDFISNSWIQTKKFFTDDSNSQMGGYRSKKKNKIPKSLLLVGGKKTRKYKKRHRR
jgi:hypothetical protein